MIPVYQSEICIGLDQKIIASTSFGIQSNAVISSSTDINQLFTKRAIAEANADQIDLYYIQSILASVGWNGNDDVFDKYETWNARSTVVDKPFNFMHNEKDIIGHLTSSKGVDNNDTIIVDDIPLDDLPDQFDIVTGAVLYRHWSDSELQKRMNTLIKEIAEDKWKVSMECLFSDFDYAVITPDGEHKVIKRTEASAFLTKHLKVYGGSGEYDGYKLGRLPRGFVFSGKGLVDQPANPRSNIITFSNKEEVNKFAAAAAMDISKTSINEELHMADVSYTQEQYAFLQTQLDEVKAALVTKDAEIKDLQTQLTSAADANKSVAKAAQVTQDEVVATKDLEIQAFTKKLEESTTLASDLQGKLDKIEAEQAKTARLAKVLEREIVEDKAQVLVEQFTTLSDEQFDIIVNTLPEKVVADTSTTEEIVDKKEDEVIADDIKDVEEAQADETKLNSDKADATADITTAAASWLSGMFSSTAKLQQK